MDEPRQRGKSLVRPRAKRRLSRHKHVGPHVLQPFVDVPLAQRLNFRAGPRYQDQVRDLPK